MTTFGGLPPWQAVLAAAILIAYLSLFPAVFALIQARFLRALGRGSLLLAPAVWVATEMGRTYILDGFPWELLGYSQASVLPIAQLASVVGVYGLSAFASWSARSRCMRRSRLSAGRWTAVAAGRRPRARTSVSGARSAVSRERRWTSSGPRSGSRVIQGNIPADQKWDARLRDPIMDRYVNMTRDAIGRRAQFSCGPESATPLPYEEDPLRGEVIRRLARPGERPRCFIGSDQVEPVRPSIRESRPVRNYNAAYLVQPDGSTAAIYRKIHLVPFGNTCRSAACCVRRADHLGGRRHVAVHARQPKPCCSLSARTRRARRSATR
jgi:apolipoprotein N-acyltransferase